jgi:hypothetical protein
VNFVRDLGSEGQRLDLRPRLSYPWSPGGFFTLTPRLGVRETIYDTEVIGTKIDRGLVVEDTEKEFVFRTLLEAGADWEARAWRVFDLDGAMGIQRIQHVIEPRVTYNYREGDDSANVPQWDGIDFIVPSHTVTYSLTNRVKARAVGDGDRPGVVWELLRFTLSQTYSIDPPPIVTSVVGEPAPVTPVPTTTVAALRRLRRFHPRHRGRRSVRDPGDQRHHRPVLRGLPLARGVRHPARRQRGPRVHPGLAGGPDRLPLGVPLLDGL